MSLQAPDKLYAGDGAGELHRAGAPRPRTALLSTGRLYLSPDRLPVQAQWSRKHAHTQRRLCERFAVPVIGTIACQDIRVARTQQIVNAAPTPGEGDRVQGMSSALAAVGIDGGYLANPRLARVHWQAAGRHGDLNELMVNTAAYSSR